MSTNTVNIVVKEDGSRVVKRNLEDLGESALNADEAVETLKKGLEALVAAEAVRAIVEMVNEYQELHNQLQFVTTGQANLNAVFDKLSEVAASTGTSVAQNVAEYQSLTQATHDLGLSQSQVIAFQARLNEATKLSTGSSEGAAQAIEALSKSLTTGRLEGATFTRTLQQVPVVGDILAKSLGVTRGQLKDMADQGTLSAKQLVDAFEKAGPQLDAQFKNLQPTISETFSDLKDQLMLTVGAFSDATGAGNLVAQTIKSITEFVKEITPEVVSFAQALTGTLDPSTELSDGMKVFASIIVVTIGVLKELAQIIYNTVGGAFKTVGQLIGGIAAFIHDFSAGLIDEFTAIIQGIAAVPDAIKKAAVGDFEGAGKALHDAFAQPWDDAGKDFDRAATDLTNTIDDFAQNIDNTFQDNFDVIFKGGEDMWSKLDKIWDEGSRNLQKKTALGTVSTKAGPNVTTQFSAQEIEATRKALASLLASFDPVGAAYLKLADDVKLLDKAQREGIITKQQEAQYIDELRKHYEDILAPVQAYMRTIDQQTNLLKFNADQRQIETEILQKQIEWTKQGIKYNQDEIDSIRSKLQAQQDLSKVVNEQDTLLQGSVEKRKEFTTQLTAIQNLLKDPTSGFGKGDATNALASASPDLFQGTQELQDAQLQSYQTMYQQIDALRQADLISENTASQMKAKVAIQQNSTRLQQEDQFWGGLASLSRSGNKELAAIGKAAAITQATIDGIAAVQKALASAPPPINYALAAAVGVETAANIASILSQGTAFATGGTFNVGGTGGTDSQVVAFRATPGEQVAVSTPQQVRHGAGAGQQGSGAAPTNVTVNPQIINVRDPSEIPSAIQSSEGTTAILNVISNNNTAIKQMLGG